MTSILRFVKAGAALSMVGMAAMVEEDSALVQQHMQVKNHLLDPKKPQLRIQPFPSELFDDVRPDPNEEPVRKAKSRTDQNVSRIHLRVDWTISQLESGATIDLKFGDTCDNSFTRSTSGTCLLPYNTKFSDSQFKLSLGSSAALLDANHVVTMSFIKSMGYKFRVDTVCQPCGFDECAWGPIGDYKNLNTKFAIWNLPPPAVDCDLDLNNWTAVYNGLDVNQYMGWKTIDVTAGLKIQRGTGGVVMNGEVRIRKMA